MSKKILYGFYMLLLLGAYFIYVSTCLSQPEHTVINNEGVVAYLQGWQYTINGIAPAENKITLPTKVDAQKNDRVVIRNTLPEQYNEPMTICFRSVQQFVRIWVGGEQIYEYGYASDRPFGKSPGSAWNFIRLDKSTQGEELEIELVSPYDGYARGINEIYYGTKSANVFHIIDHNMGGAILSALIVVVGIGLMVAHFILKKRTESRSLLYLGLFALLAGCWSMTETRLLQFMFDDQFVITLVAFVLVQLLLIPLLLFIMETHALHQKKQLVVLCWLLMGNFLLSMGLQVCDIVDFIEFPFVTHSLIILTIVTTVITILVELIKYKNREIVILGVGTMALALISILDFLQVYKKCAGDSSFFFRIGVLIYIVALAAHTANRLVAMVAQNLRTAMLEQLAFADTLTKLQNRTAFERDLTPYREDTARCDGLSFGIFDINNLKLVNDNYGHPEGDRLIVLTAECLSTCFASVGQTYRMGGDEFAVLAQDVPASVLSDCQWRFEELLAQRSAELAFHTQVASAVVTFDPEQDKTVYSLYTRADAAMYEQKARIKGLTQ